ncbi:MAG TPA: alkaline phosphatase family protein [Terriglobia bacterium]|nr:alkaline phosphatase family protein [Terriglobia bacterium]
MTTTGEKHLSVFVLIDALGWRFLQGRRFLSDLCPYRVPMRTVLGFCSGAIPTILTGVPPALNGHWNLFYFDPEESPFRWLRRFGFLPRRLLDHPVTRKLVEELGRRALGLGSNFECSVSPRLLPWFDWIERRNIYDPDGIAGARSIFDELAADGIPYRVYTYHRRSDRDILTRAKHDLEASDARFFFLYLRELDRLFHTHGHDEKELDSRLASYEDRLRELFLTAQRRDPEAVLAVFSDHGMTPVENTYDLAGDIDRLGFAMPEDYLAVYDPTMARFWFFRGSARAKIAGCLRGESCGRILSEDELRDLGILFPDRRYGELIFLLHPGWLLARNDSNKPGRMPAGMHGYHPDDPYSDAVFFSNRSPSKEVRALADVYHVMREAAAGGCAEGLGTRDKKRSRVES